MHPVHDIDALLLMAATIASRRRPAELGEIVAAIEFFQPPLPAAAKLAEALRRFAINGLILEVEGGYTLTPEAQKIMTGQPKKGEIDARIFSVKEKLAAHISKEDGTPIQVTPEQVSAALLVHQKSGQSKAKNLLMPKPKTEDDNKRPGLRQRKPMPARKRKD